MHIFKTKPCLLSNSTSNKQQATSNKLILLLFLVLINFSTVFAQFECDTFKIRTNPTSALNNQKPSKTNIFDWRTPSFVMRNIYDYLEPAIASPFYQDDNELTDHFFVNKDMEPRDGWELIKRDFGIQFDTTAIIPLIDECANPYIVLYNKYTATQR